MDTRRYVLDYYENTRNHFGTYHDHKEKTAWGGLVFQVLFCRLAIQMEPAGIQAYVAIGAIIILTIVMFVYIRNQLSLKDSAGAIVSVSTAMLSIIMMEKGLFMHETYMKTEGIANSGSKTDSDQDTSLNSYADPDRDISHICIDLIIDLFEKCCDHCKLEKMQIMLVLPDKLRRNIERMNKLGRGCQDRTKYAIFSILFLSTLIYIIESIILA